jgi:D-amino-acid dehydrogenase
MQERFDTIVIGAGIVGVSTALHLQMRGKKVLLIDRRDPGEETSFGNAGVMEMARVLPFGFPPMSRWLNIALNRDPMARIDYVSLHRSLPWIIKFFFQSQPRPQHENGRKLWPLIVPSLNEHHYLMQGTDAAKHWQSTGRVTLYRSEHSFVADADYLQAAQEAGVPFDVMNAGAFSAIEPDVRPAYVKAVRWTSTARTTNPSALIKVYAERFTREGGVFSKTNVKRIDAFANKWRVGTSSGTMEAPDIVLCMGPWTTDITKQLGYRFPLGFKRGYHRHFSAVGPAKLSHTLSDAEFGYALAPMEQGYRIATGAEFADRDAPPHPQQLDLILARARELFPIGETVDAKPWMGSRPCFTDSLPMIGPAPRHKGLWFNFGHGHVGLTIGPSSGRLLAEMMTGATPFCDPSPYRANRFSC